MSTNLGKDVLTLPDDKYEELERLSALGYSEADMAMYFDVPGDDFWVMHILNLLCHQNV